MEIVIRNITKDTMEDFNNDHIINLPMDEEKLRKFLGKDEWIIIGSPIGGDMTNILGLNQLLTETDEETLRILAKAFFYYDEIKEMIEDGNYTIIDFKSETQEYNYGNGVFADDWWKGFLLFQLGYEKFPFEYTEKMEDYVKFEQLWYTADSEGWCDVTYDGKTYLVKRWYV